MKRFFSLFCVVLLSVALPVVSADDAGAQGQIYVTDAASAAASDIINGRVVSTISVEVDGEMHRATEIEISSAPKGSLSGSVLVETPGGERADGTVMFVSHTPELIPNELVQLALMPAEHHTSAVLPVAMGRDLPVYSVAGGSDGAWGLLPDGVGRANAVGDYSLTGSSWPDFAPPVPFNVNYRNSGISESATIEAVKQGFQIWEDDPGSTVEFSYSGETTKVGVNLEDNVNTVSWVTPPAGTGWLAQANWMATTNGEILGFDIRVSRNYDWSNGAASGRYDIATVVAHEVGHGIGLGHGPSSSDLMHALIQQGSAKGLGAGDRSGAAFLYPDRSFGKVYEPGHSVAANPAGDLVSVHIKEDGRLFLRVDIGSVPATWQRLGSVNNWISADVSLDNDGNLQVVGLKVDGVLFTRFRAASGAWSGWVNHGGGWSTKTMPSISMSASGSSVLAAVSAGAQLQVKTGVGSSWSNWQTQGSGGWAQVDIDIASDGDVWFVGVKSNGRLFVRKNIGAGWSNFRQLGLPTWSPDTPPTIGAHSTGVVVGGVKVDGRVFTLRQSSNAWQSWVRHGLADWSGIDLAVNDDGDVVLAGVKSYGRLFLRTQKNGAWSSWTRLGLDTWAPPADPSVAFIRGDDPIFVAVKEDGDLFLRERVNSTWRGWKSLGLGGWAPGR